VIVSPAFKRPADEARVSIAPGLSLHYLDWPGVGPPVLLLHGSKSNARAWDFVADTSTMKDRHFLAPDLRGHGLSDAPPTGYQIEALTADVGIFSMRLSSSGPSSARRRVATWR
jgi:pimeloyl-ACP methyl ester carboxylesterase